jgi:GTP cyclohydrolase I
MNINKIVSIRVHSWFISCMKTKTNEQNTPRPSREDAEKAIETLIRYLGEDPSREGLRETPARVVRAWDEYCEGYGSDEGHILDKTFSDLVGFDDFVLVKNISFVSHCEHHMAPIIGVAHVAYWPDKHVVGISKLGRIVDMYAHRLSSQETMTRRIVEALETHLKPKGIALTIDAEHHCMSDRGVKKPGSSTVTSLFTGIFKERPNIQQRFLENIRA